jgi:hypothetical protein
VRGLLAILIDRVLQLDEEVGGDPADPHHLAGAEADGDGAEVVLEIKVPDCPAAWSSAVKRPASPSIRAARAFGISVDAKKLRQFLSENQNLI